MKPIAVLDSSVVVSGIGWASGSARAVLVLLAKRRFISVRTPWLTGEWTDVIQRVSKELKWGNRDWPNWLDWLKRSSVLINDPAMRPTVRRDPKDDPVLAAAVSSGAQFLVAYDRHLLDVERPYGVSCLTPAAFVSAVLKGG